MKHPRGRKGPRPGGGGHHHRQQHREHGRAHHHKGPALIAGPLVHTRREHRPRTHHRKRQWSPGLDVACCAAEAVAASLRLAGGNVSPADTLDLYWHTASDPDAGASILATLEAVSDYGLAGVKPLSFTPAKYLSDGVIVGTTMAGGPHAVTVEGDGLWTWAEWHRWQCPVEEAWSVTW